MRKLIITRKEKPEVEMKKLEYTGLCTNCDNRKECKIRDKDFVVWHCEEYK